MEKLKLEDYAYGNLLPFIKDKDVTDINWNGTELWLDNVNKGRYKVKDFTLSSEFIKSFYTRIANLMNAQFNQEYPILEAETNELRLSFINEYVTNTGISISIRKTPPERKMNRATMIEQGYAPEKLIVFFKNCVKAGCTMVAGGLPGVGKTEFIKWLTKYIPPNEKVFTIEDTLELRYAEINKGKDCVEIKVTKEFGYPEALKASKRQLPTWVLVAESRGEEVVYLMENISSGVHCLTTAHMDSVLTLPDRFVNMGANINVSDVYNFVDIGIYIQIRKDDGKIRRRISQVAMYSRDDGENKTTLLYDNGRFLIDFNRFPESLKRKFKNMGIENPFEDLFVEEIDESMYEENLKDVTKEYEEKTLMEIREKEKLEKETNNKITINKKETNKKK